MKLFDPILYTIALRTHYENHFGIASVKHTWNKGPVEKLNRNFAVLEFPPGTRHQMWTYCSSGMSVDKLDNNLIELFMFSHAADDALVELLTMCASYHRTGLPLNIHHTVNLGKPWLKNSKCDHAFISLPYLDGEELELFNFDGEIIHCCWLIPITEKERDYNIENGFEALEQLFEEKQINYLDPDRNCLISGT